MLERDMLAGVPDGGVDVAKVTAEKSNKKAAVHGGIFWSY
jgi:glutamine phosphoribosylpyrophosphate amidotransferase